MTTQIDNHEDIEGLGDETSSWGDYPIDTMLIRNEHRTVEDVLRRIDQGMFILDPDFQRDFIWDQVKQSKLIESVMMRIPLPVFYLAENDDGRMVIVDGLQRLSTFQRFMNNQLRLKLEEESELNGKIFDELSPKLQIRFGDCNLIFYIVDSNVPEQARLDIFERVNGGVPLTRQQMRNCLFMGEATKFLKEESRTELFLEATGKSLRTSTMRDREFVNRFCAFQLLDLNQYRGMDEFLAKSLKKMNRQPEILTVLADQFETTLENNLILFGRHAFRKHDPGQENRSILNASLWDVMSTGLSRYPTDLIDQKASSLKNSFYGLLKDQDFNYSITYGTNSMQQVKHRFTITNAMFKDVFDAD